MVYMFKQQKGNDFMKTITYPMTNKINNQNNNLNDNVTDLTIINTSNFISNNWNNINNITNLMNYISEPCDKTQEAIASFDDINKVIAYYLDNAYSGLVNVNIEKVIVSLRNVMLFICGINMGIRVSDLRKLRYAHLINSNSGGFKKYFFINEKKTSKANRIYVNEAVRTIVTLFLQVTNAFGRVKDLQDYLFVDERAVEESDKSYEEILMTLNNEYSVVLDKVQAPLSYTSISPITTKACKYLGIKGKHNTHCLRKTFAWAVTEYYKDYYGVDDNSNSRALLFLQYRFKHSSTLITEHYLGLTNKEDETVCMNLNLGLKYVSDWMKLCSDEISRCSAEYKHRKENNRWYCY